MSFSDDFSGASAGDELQTLVDWVFQNQGTSRFTIDGAGTALTAKGSGGGSGRGSYTCPDQADGDHETSIDFINGSVNNCLPCAVRMVDEDNFVGGEYGGTGSAGYRLHKFIGGTKTQLIGTQSGNGATLTMKVSAEGEDYKLFEDDVQFGTTQVVINADLSTSETSQGVVNNGASVGTTGHFDDFLAAALGAPAAGGLLLTNRSIANYQGIRQ